MTGVDRTIAIMTYFLNNCHFDQDGNPSCAEMRQDHGSAPDMAATAGPSVRMSAPCHRA